MILFPAIDLYDKKVVRLYKGKYDEMTVYSENPTEIALDFADQGATHIHIVDLEGAKSGETPNMESIISIKERSHLFCEVGGGIRSIETIEKYVKAGIDRIIIGTAAVKDEAFLLSAINKYSEKIAVGVDVRDGYVSVNGWTESTDVSINSFCSKLQAIGVNTIICTDISKDGAMSGTNMDMYKNLSGQYQMNIIASGGISSINDIIKLNQMGIYGAIIGKAYYTGAINLKEALGVCE